MNYRKQPVNRAVKLCFATRNPHKLQEIAQRLPVGFELIGLDDLGHHEELPETGDTLEENSREKALYVHRTYGLDCCADDTGLEVPALGGAPGVHSAHYAGDSRDSAANIALLLRKLEGAPDRRARFRTVITLIRGGVERQFEGVVEGSITTVGRGHSGFGYDPVFLPAGSDRCFAEMSLEEKNTMSHRARAFDQLIAFLANPA